MSVFVRTSGGESPRTEELRKIVREIDPNIPVTRMRRMETQVASSVYVERLIAWLAGAFGVLALVLAAVGLYGVIEYLTTRRTVEIGIRMALGATRQSVLRLVLRDTGVMAAIGLVAGVPCALAAARLVRSQLFGVQANDPWVLGLGIVVLCAVAVAASYGPARRAAGVDPARALRNE